MENGQHAANCDCYVCTEAKIDRTSLSMDTAAFDAWKARYIGLWQSKYEERRSEVWFWWHRCRDLEQVMDLICSVSGEENIRKLSRDAINKHKILTKGQHP